MYQVKYWKLGRDVAIKVLPEEFAKNTGRAARIRREADMLVSLNQNNIAASCSLQELRPSQVFTRMELVQNSNQQPPKKRYWMMLII